jgi:hypothetical protein
MLKSHRRLSATYLLLFLRRNIMSQEPGRRSPEQRLRFLRYGLIIVVAVTFALATATGLFSKAGDIGAAMLQGVLWTVVAAVAAVIIYFVYKKVVVKA